MKIQHLRNILVTTICLIVTSICYAEISGAIKKLTLCNFSHTGMVVRDPSKAVRDAYHVPDSETDTVFCWEANMSTHPPRPGGGTHMPTLRWKFERALVRECEDYVLCVRKLVLENVADRKWLHFFLQFLTN